MSAASCIGWRRYRPPDAGGAEGGLVSHVLGIASRLPRLEIVAEKAGVSYNWCVRLWVWRMALAVYVVQTPLGKWLS